MSWDEYQALIAEKNKLKEMTKAIATQFPHIIAFVEKFEKLVEEKKTEIDKL